QNVAIFGTYARYDGLLTTVTYAALFWLAVQVIDGPGEARMLLRVLLASAFVASLLALAQVAYDSLTQGVLVPAYGTLGQKNTLGGFLAMTLPLAAYELVDARSWNARIAWGNVLVVIATTLVLTFSRSAWLAAGLAMTIVALWLARSRGLRTVVVPLSA